MEAGPSQLSAEVAAASDLLTLTCPQCLLGRQLQTNSQAGCQKAQGLVWVKRFKPAWHLPKLGLIGFDDAAH